MTDNTVPDALVDRFRDGQITRREFVATALKLGLSVSAAGGLLAACGSSPTKAKATTTTVPPTGVAKTLAGTVQVLVGFGTGNSPMQVQVQQALANAFMRTNPGVKIQFLRITGGSSNAGTKLTTLIAGGNLGPTIAIPVGVYGTSLFVDQGVWLDLAPYFSRDGISLSQFLPNTFSATRVNNYYGADSSVIIGVPVGVNDHALAYNEELFSKAGVAPPPLSWTDPSWTLGPGSKMLDTATALTLDSKGHNPNKAGFDASKIVQFGLGNFFRETVYYDFGGHLYDAATRKAQFDQPDSIAGIAFATDLVNKYHVEPTSAQLAVLGAAAGAGGDQAAAAWRAGKLAMIDMCTCNLMTDYTDNLPFSFKVAAMPAGPKRRFCFLNLDLGSIVAPSQDHDLSWEVLKYLTVDPTAEAKLAYQSDGAIPPLKVNSSDFSQGVTQAYKGVDPSGWLDGLPSSSEENEEWLPAFAQVNDLDGMAFDAIIAGAPAAPAMAGLQRAAQAAIDTWFKTHELPT